MKLWAMAHALVLVVIIPVLIVIATWVYAGPASRHIDIVVAIGVWCILVVTWAFRRPAESETAADGPRTRCMKCGEDVPQWFIEAIELGRAVADAHVESYCWTCTRALPYPSPKQSLADYNEQQRRHPPEPIVEPPSQSSGGSERKEKVAGAHLGGDAAVVSAVAESKRLLVEAQVVSEVGALFRELSALRAGSETLKMDAETYCGRYAAQLHEYLRSRERVDETVWEAALDWCAEARNVRPRPGHRVYAGVKSLGDWDRNMLDYIDVVARIAPTVVGTGTFKASAASLARVLQSAPAEQGVINVLWIFETGVHVGAHMAVNGMPLPGSLKRKDT